MIRSMLVMVAIVMANANAGTFRAQVIRNETQWHEEHTTEGASICTWLPFLCDHR